MISPFNVYGHIEQTRFVSQAEQKNATYTKPADTADRKHSFYSQQYGVEPNIASVCSIDACE